jgi:hypothetical protein
MLIRIIKTTVYYGARKATTSIKLLAARKAAKEEMDRLELLMKAAFDDDTLTKAECGKQFDSYFDQHKRFSRIYSKTF